MLKIRDLTTKEKLYATSYFFAFLYSFLPATMLSDVLIPSSVGKFLLSFSILLMLIKVVLYDYFSLGEFLFYGFIFVIVALNGIKVDAFSLVLLVVMFIGSRNINHKLIIKISFLLLLIGLIVVISFSLLGIIPNLKYGRSDNTNLVRYSMGTAFPTVFGSFIFFIVLQYTYLKEKLNFKDLFFVAFLAVVTHYLTDNRLVTVLLALFIITQVLIMNDSITNKFENNYVKNTWILIYFLPLIVILFLSLTYDDSSTIYMKINSLLSGRLNLSHRGFTEFGTSLLGQELPIVGFGGVEKQVENYFYLDTLTVDILIKNGLLIFLIYIFYNVKAITFALKNNKIQLAIILSLIILYDTIDNKSVYIAYNSFPLIISASISDQRYRSGSIVINKERIFKLFKKR